MGKIATVWLSDFEKCLLTKMRMHTGMSLERIGLMYGRHRGRYVNEWMPRWGEAGEMFPLFDINAELIADLRPSCYGDVTFHTHRVNFIESLYATRARATCFLMRVASNRRRGRRKRAAGSKHRAAEPPLPPMGLY